MEKYQGVKFRNQQVKSSFSYDDRLSQLNRWAYLFSQIGLAPVHSEGAYGNHSYRTGKTSFIISKSAMIPSETLQPDDFCHVTDFEASTSTFLTEGTALPSSECFLHNELYQALPEINVILHGHCSLLNIHAETLKIPVTKIYCDYGTPELADSALAVVGPSTRFFILRDHGFVALAGDIDFGGNLTLDYYSKLIQVLRTD